MWKALPAKEIFSPAKALRMICTVSRIRVSGRANGTPCSPSITCGPDGPSPSANRPPDISARVSAACASATGVRTPSCMIPEPSRIRSVRAAR